MATHRLDIIMHDITGRMGYRAKLRLGVGNRRDDWCGMFPLPLAIGPRSERGKPGRLRFSRCRSAGSWPGDRQYAAQGARTKLVQTGTGGQPPLDRVAGRCTAFVRIVVGYQRM